MSGKSVKDLIPGLFDNGELEKAKGGQGCGPRNDMAANAAAIAKDPQANLKAVAELMKAKPKCVKTAENSTTEFMNDKSDFQLGVVPFAIGVNDQKETTTMSTMDDKMREEGCGSLMNTSNRIMSSVKNMSCTLQSSLTKSNVVVKAGSTIKFNVRARSDKEVAAIERAIDTRRKNDANIINMYKIDTVALMAVGGKEALKTALDDRTRMIEKLTDSFDKWALDNPIQPEIVGNKFDFQIKSDIKMSEEQTITTEMAENIMADIKNIAGAKAINTLEQENGVRALTPDTMNLVQNEVNSLIEKEKTSIQRQITESNVAIDDDNNIILNFPGNVRNNTFKAGITSQIDAQVSQAIGTAMDIADRAVMSAQAKATAHNDMKQENKGLEDLKKAQMDGLAKQIEQSQKNKPGGGMGGFGGFGLMMMLPILIVLGVLFFAPNLISSFLSPTTIIIGIVIFVIFFGGAAFFMSSNRRRSREMMSVSPSRLDDLGYMVTETKGYVNKKPYEDFQFKTGGTWQLN
jgi:hypothetical protein